MKFATRQGRLGTETAFEVLKRANELQAKGREIVHLEIGEPDFDTAEHIIEAAVKALENGVTHYGPSAGLPEVRECFADYMTRTRGVKYSLDEIVITPGAKPIISFALLALVNEGDEVLCPDPGYPIYSSMINYIGATTVPYKLKEDLDFRIDFVELENLLTEKTKLIIINSPQNPTGGVLTRDDLKRLSEIVIKNDLWVIADEVYCYILYDGRKHQSIIQFDGMKERSVIVDGHSKTYAMTGWRLGFGAMPVEVANHVAKLCTNFHSCTAGFVQLARKAAFEGPQECVRDMVSKFNGRRRLIIAELEKIEGITSRVPKGAFYAFPNISAFGIGSKKIQNFLLDDCGVATLAGIDFGAEGDNYIRLSYANSPENILKAMDMMRKGLKNL
ncbi:MAG: pyridoxal phosphate-dependent aminotransferase [bacterium]